MNAKGLLKCMIRLINGFLSMLKRSGKFNKKQLIEAARGYLELYDNGRVPFLEVETGKVGWVVFEKSGIVYLFKEIIRH